MTETGSAVECPPGSWPEPLPGGLPTGPDAVAEVRAWWRRASLAGPWTVPSDWAAPAVEALVEALCEDADPAGPAARLGAERAAAGIGLSEALDDVGMLLALSGLPGHRAWRLLRAFGAGWADAASLPGVARPCEDPLTLLATPAYLRTRLGEVYREAAAEGVRVDHRRVLTVVRLPGPTPRPSGGDLRRVLAADCLRSAYSGGETLALAGPTHLVALAYRDDSLPARLTALRGLLADRLGTERPARMWLEQLPGLESMVDGLLRELAR